MTLRTRVVVLAIAAIIPLFGLSVAKALLEADAAVNRAGSGLQFAASLVAINQEGMANSALQILTAVVNVPDLVAGKTPECQRYFKTVNDKIPAYANLGIIGPDGYVRCHGVGSGLGGFVGDRLYFQQALTSRNFVTGGYLIGRLTGAPQITFALPAINDRGGVAAVAYVAIDLVELSKSVAHTPLPKGARLLIMDRQGIVLATHPEKSAVIGQLVSSPVLQEVVRTRSEGVRPGSDASGEQIYAFLPSGKSADSPFFVAVSLDKDQVVAPSRQQLTLEFLVLTLLAFSGGWIAWMMGRRAIVLPAAKILEATHQLEHGQLEVRVPMAALSPSGEFFLIADSFNKMADALQQRDRALETELQVSRLAYAALEQLQLALLKSTERLQITSEMAKVGGWDMSLDDMLLVWSEQTYRIHDLDSADKVDLSRAIEFYAPEARPVISAAVQRGIEDGTPWDLELPLVTAKGRHIWVRAQGRATQQDGKTLRLAGTFQDITQQHQSEEHMRLLQASVDNLNDIVLITEAEPFDEPGPRIVYVNDAFERRTGYSREEVLGKSPRFLQGPKTQRAELDRIGAALKKWQPVRAELINYKKNGEEFWLELDIVPIADATGWFTHWVAVERDVTERKLAEQALFESEQRYLALFESAPVPLWLFDLKTWKFLAVNRATVQAYGYSAEEFMSMTLFDIRPEIEHEALRQQLAGKLQLAREFWTHRRKNGSLLQVNVISQPIKYAGVDARLVVALDVTAQRKAEADVSNHLFTLLRAADAAQAITSSQGLEGTLQEFAEQARGVIGAHQAVVSLAAGTQELQTISALSLSDKYAKYRHLKEPIDGSGIYQLACETSRAIRLTQAELEAHPRWRGFGSYADKHPALRGWMAIPLTGRNGKNIGLLQLSDKYEGEFSQQDEYVAIELAQLAAIAIENAQLLEEVSQLNTGLEQKVIERTAALTRQEALFRALADQAPQVVWTASPEGMVTYLNRAWFELVGGGTEKWMGHRWFAAMHPEDLQDIRANWASATASQTPYEGIRRLRAKNGSFHTMSYRASPVFDDNGELAFWVGIDADITEMKTIEAALRLSNQELEAFSYSVSHDLRSPLNTIDGFSRLLAKQLSSEAGDRQQHYLSRIQAGVAQMGKLIDDLLSLAQVSRMQLRHELVDLSTLSQRIAEEWQAREPERKVRFQIETGLEAYGDSRLLRVVLENLLGNAWKFSSKQPQALISVGQKTDAAGLPVFFVRDNGAGFDMAYVDKLFIAFQRLHALSEFPGTGIGLATVSRVISRHGGLLWVEAAPGAGATFFFTLPKMPALV
ncbi:MAG: PAS domain S-box protein [Polaromonas sp.]|nr:PAS domain S-box protein [Polaromonas sp.]